MEDKRKISKKTKRTLMEKIINLVRDKKDIIFAYIFGSFVSMGRFKDIDMGIFVLDEKSKLSLKFEMELEREIEDILHIPVDVRILNNASPSFIFNVIKNGVLVLDRNSSHRADFEGLIYKKYFDFQHLRKEYLKEILNAPI